MNMNLIEWTGWAATAVALVGVWMNNRRRRTCFVMWLVSNAITFGIHTAAGMWSLAARDGAFFIMAIHGWWRWGADSCKESSSEERQGTGC